MEQEERTLRIAIIGAGQVAQTTHIPNLIKIGNNKIVGISDTKLEAVRATAAKFGIDRYYDSHKKMLEELHPDAVFICVPNRFHCSIALDALHMGCNVMCEKPPALTAEEAREMEQAADLAGKILTYGFHLRYSENVRIAKDHITSGKAGKIYHAEARWMRRRGIPGWGTFTNREIQGGGPLIDLGAHYLDCVMYLMGYPEIRYVCASWDNEIGKNSNVGFMGSWDPKNFEVEDGLFGYIKFENEASLNISTAFAINQKAREDRTIRLYGAKEGISVFPLEFYGEQDGTLCDIAHPFVKDRDWHFDLDCMFVNACLGKEKLLVSAHQGTYIQEIIAALYQSAVTNRPVVFNHS